MVAFSGVFHSTHVITQCLANSFSLCFFWFAQISDGHSIDAEALIFHMSVFLSQHRSEQCNLIKIYLSQVSCTGGMLNAKGTTQC